MNIRILSYNIHRAIGFDRRFAPERIATILREHDADIVMLQEVDEGVPRSQEMNLAKVLADDAGYDHFALGHNVSMRKGRYGNATLSRFPIVRERNIDLTVGRRKRRGCQHTTIALPNSAANAEAADGDANEHHLEVFNLHLGLSARERQQQATILSHSHEFSDLGEDTPCIVAGDFNDWRSLLRGFYTQDFGFNCATDSMNHLGRVRALRTFPSFAPRGGLDRVYYRGPLEINAVQRCGVKLSRIASDHLAVIVDFEVPAPG